MSPEDTDFSSEQKFELAKQQAELAVRRHEAIWSTLKAIGVALVGTAAVGITTAVVNYDIQQGELELKVEETRHELQIADRNQEQEYLQQFLEDALSVDIQRRVDFAQYVSSVTMNPEMRKLWVEYHTTLETELTNTRKDLEAKVKELDAALMSAEEDGSASELHIPALKSEVTNLSQRLSKELPSFDKSQVFMELARPAETREKLRLLGWEVPWSCDELLAKGEAAAIKAVGPLAENVLFVDALGVYVFRCVEDRMTASR